MTDSVTLEIKNRLDIVDVLSGYIQVKKSGTNFKAVCPFHAEKSASLMISPAKQIWHCFGCGEGGDIFGFLMRYENLDFREALESLAQRAGVALPAFQKSSVAEKSRTDFLIRINSFAAKFFNQTLFMSENKKVLEYLYSRGLADTVIRNWQIGFAPNDFHSLEKLLLAKKVPLSDMVLAGVSIKGDNGGQYDRFRNRVTFPIFNYQGEVVGFSARVLPGNNGEDQAKYVNSPETGIYNKSQILFGLNFAKNEIRKKDEVVVVEGQMDCISAHAAGFANTVATSGTALTSQQLALLQRLTKNVKFCFDADLAGKKALEKAGFLAMSMGFSVKVIVLPSGKDPDELIRTSKEAWQTAASEAVWFIDFHIASALREFPINSVEQKKYVNQNILPLVSLIADPVEQDHYISRLTQEFGIKDIAIRQALKIKKPISVNNIEEGKAVEALETAPTLDLEKKVLGGLLLHSSFVSEAAKILEAKDFTPNLVSGLIFKVLANNLTLTENELVLAREAEFMVESELEYLEGNQTALLNELQKSLYQLKLIAIKRHQQELSSQIRQAELNAHRSLLQQLQTEFAKLSEERLGYERKV